MYKNLKSEIKDIIEIVNQCPEALQEKCFELLLSNYLKSDEQTKMKDDKTKTAPITTASPVVEEIETTREPINDEEIALTDFHIKTRRYFEANNITIDMINRLYYKEEEKIIPLYESLNSNKMSDCQIRLALLTAFENSFSNSGEMIFNGETVRQRCNDLKCYDAPHFADTFKRYSSYFDNWNTKYDKKTNYSLSAEGKKELANILVDLADGE